MSHSRVRADVFETLIRERSAATPDGTAVLEDGGLSTTYAELDERASRTANALVSAGIEPGDRVAFVGENSTAFLATLFGAAKCGAVLVAVNHRLSPAEVDYILRDARPAALVLGRGH